ncbi:MAG: MMPL family transporter [Pseudomonadales bacterium]|nr:MMPL family transporter [Pseudomonadales bacterium]
MSRPSNLLERFVFSLRGPILFVFIALSIFFANQTYDVAIDSSLKKMVPLSHPYIQNLYKHKDELSLGNDIRIAVEHTQGDIFDAEYLEILRQISDEAFYLPGVNKGSMKSLWTPNVRWSAVDTYGFQGGEVIPPNYDGSDEAIAEVRRNVLRSDQIGFLVSDDMKSSIIYLPLIDVGDGSKDNPNKIDYKLLADQIELGIRKRFESDKIKIHVIGFAKKIGDLIDAAKDVLVFFILTLLITFHILIFDSRCVRSASVIVVGAVMAVIWQLGIISLLHKGMSTFREMELWQSLINTYPTIEPIQFGIDPYSMLVPFLVFAIAISHGVQYTNDMARRIAKGESAQQASKNTFQALFIPGLLALVSDAFGFVTLWFIDIGVIRELAITASVGVAVIILTKLIFVPIVLSYIGISELSVRRLIMKQGRPSRFAKQISTLTQKRTAALSLITASIIAVAGFVIKQDLKIGDLDAGAPELHPDSRYNLDNAFITGNYSVSADVLVVMVETPPSTCTTYPPMTVMDDFMWHMENVEGVESSTSVVSISKHLTGAFNEGSIKWATLSRVPEVLNSTMIYLPNGFINTDCSLVPIFVFLEDHKAETLERAVTAVEEFSNNNKNKDVADFILASGNAGVEAATNQTIRVAELRILIMVFSVVAIMVFMAFRSWRAVVCVVLPLFLTSVLCEALMTLLGIGVKVATLPVIALGVGIGVDYGIYIFASMQRNLASGLTLQDAYLKTLLTTGRSVVLTCFTLSISVGFWVFSSIKFQADMGILLTFMFLWNMVGAIWLLPALAHFLPMQPKHTLTIPKQNPTPSTAP